jgi:hypothetical protein
VGAQLLCQRYMHRPGSAKRAAAASVLRASAVRIAGRLAKRGLGDVGCYGVPELPVIAHGFRRNATHFCTRSACHKPVYEDQITKRA